MKAIEKELKKIEKAENRMRIRAEKTQSLSGRKGWRKRFRRRSWTACRRPFQKRSI